LEKRNIIRDYIDSFYDFLIAISRNRLTTSSSLQKITNNKEEFPIQLQLVFNKLVELLKHIAENNNIDDVSVDIETLHAVALMQSIMVNREKSFEKLVDDLEEDPSKPAYFMFPENFFNEDFKDQYLSITDFNKKHNPAQLFTDKDIIKNINPTRIRELFRPIFDFNRNLLIQELTSLFAFFDAFIISSQEIYLKLISDLNSSQIKKILVKQKIHEIMENLGNSNLILLNLEKSNILRDARKRRNLFVHNGGAIDNEFIHLMKEIYNLKFKKSDILPIDNLYLEKISSVILKIAEEIFTNIIKTYKSKLK